MTSPNNPYDICTWRPEAECADCALTGHLKCRFNRRDLLHFVGMFGVFAIPAVLGVIQGGYGWYLLGRCVNLSCPLNTVPPEIADAYLARNPVMRRAFQEGGGPAGQ